MKHYFFFRILSLCCLVVLVLPLAVACSGASGAETSELISVTQDENGGVEATLLLSDADLDAHKGETLFLYELLPGERFENRERKDPVAEAWVSGEVKLKFDRHDGDHDRLYSSFLPVFADGKAAADARMIDDPTVGAPSHPYLWSGNPKGLYTADPTAVLSLNASHTVVTVELDELNGEGETIHRYAGKDYPISADALSTLDAAVQAGEKAGMQVSLSLRFRKAGAAMRERVAMIDFLAARYIKNGSVTALLLAAQEESVDVTASLLTLAQHAALSRNKEARVYLTAPTGNLAETTAYFAAIGKLTARYALPWGASLSYVAAETPSWENADKSSVTPETLTDLVASLSKQTNSPSYRAITAVGIAADTPERQAAEFAHLYAKASDAHFDLILWGAHYDRDYGLYDMDGTARPVADLFSDIDAGLSENQLLVCKDRSEALYTLIKKLTPTRHKLSGTGSSGTGSGKSELLYDFTDGALHGFYAPNGRVQSMLSGAYNANVLYATFEKGVSAPVLMTVLPNGHALRDATSLSFHFLAQYAQSVNDSCTLTLTLTGTDTAGNTLTLSANAPTSTRSWQNVSFHITPFVSSMDPDRPVTLTLCAKDDADAPGAMSLWIKSVRVYSPEGEYGLWLTLGLSGGGIALGFLVIFYFYRKRNKYAQKGGV